MAGLITALVCSAVLPLIAHAGSISSTVIPSETRRQGLAQENPCPGDTVLFTCTISSSTTAVRWSLDGTQLYTFVNPDDINNTESSNGLTGTLVNATTTTLSIDLSATLNTEVTNGTVIGCEEVGGITTTETLTIIGIASAPTVSVHPGSLTSITVDMTVPEYGRECVDMYRATAVVGGVTLEQTMTVTDPNQMMYSFEFSGLDLCRDMLTSATVVAVTNGVVGTMATPVTTDPLSGTNLLQVQLLDDGISSQRQLTSPIRWSQQLNITTVPSDCVSHFVVSWTGSATGSYSTSNASTFSVTPKELDEGGLQVCASVTLTISPFVSRIGAVTTSAAVVNDQPAYVPMEDTNITGLPLSDFMEVDGNVHITVRIYDESRFQQFGLVSVEPSGPSVASQSRGSSTSFTTWTVVFSGVTRGTTYTYTLVPQNANGDTIGTAITGTFVLPMTSSTLSCSNACIGVVVGLSMIVIIILSIVITFLLTYCVMKKRINQLQQSHQPQEQAMYEGMTNFQPGDDDFKMIENSAYGPVKH